MSKLGKVSGEVRANGKEKSFFFSGFGKKKKAEKPQYDGDMKNGKANGKVSRPAANAPCPCDSFSCRCL